MKSISRQFAAWVTNFKSKPFLFARLKLAIIYTLGVLVILAVFNVLVFELFVKDLPEHLETPASEEAEERLENALFIADGFILFFVALFSYSMAGFALKPIEQSYERQRKFVADAAHELRTPLAVMKTGMEAVLDGKAEKEDYRKIVEESLEEINYLSAMVDGLLFLAKNDNLQKPQLSKVNLSKLLFKQIELMARYAKSRDVALKENIEGEFSINGNEAYLKRMAANLIQNAIDYNKPKGEVVVSLRESNGQVELKIADTGIGIAKEDLPNIFERFTKADQARARKSSGAGLGLSIVKEIVALHKGNIGITSELNKGTIVRIVFSAVHS